MLSDRRRTEVRPMIRRALSTTLIALMLLAIPAAANARPVGIGDSVMLGARDQLRARGFAVNAHVDRQFWEGVDIVERLARDGNLPRHVVVHLGNNGYLSMDSCHELVDAVGHRELALVNLHVPRSWRDENNDRLARCAHGEPNVHVIDWNGYSHGHDAWFADDGYHLTPLGARRYAGYVAHHV
jgi:hypothetical protein